MGGAAVDIKGKANVSVYNGVMSAGVSTGCNSAGTTGTVSQQLIFCGGNNITLSESINGQSATITIIGGAGGSGGGTTFSAGVSNLSNDSGQTGIVTNQIVFAGGNNITLSQSSNAGGYATVTIMGAAAGTGAGINAIGAGSQTATSGTIIFQNSNSVSFGMSNSSVITAEYALKSHDSVYHTGTVAAESQVTFDPVAGHDHDGVDSKLITTPGNASSILVNVKEMNASPILKGQACYVAGATGGVLTVGLANCSDAGKLRAVGLALDNIAQNGFGVITNKGVLTGVDTRPTNLAVNPNAENWAPGELLWITTTGGGMTHTRPDSGRSVKAAYTIKGSDISDDLLVICVENPVWSTAANNENVVLRVGDAAGVNKVSIRDNNNTEVASIDSLGNVSSLNIDAYLPTANEKASFVGTSGTPPSAANPLVDNDDPRLSGGATSSQIPGHEENVSAIVKGQVLSFTGSTGTLIQFGLGNNTNTTHNRIAGIAKDNYVQDTDCVAISYGILAGVDTRTTNLAVNPNAEIWNVGDLLWMVTGGGMSNVRPTSGRCTKVARTVKGNNISDTLISIPFENPVWATAAATENVVLRLGDIIGVCRVSIRDYDNNEVASIDSDGNITSIAGIDATKIQGKDFPTLGAGDDEKFPKFDHDTSAFVMTPLINCVSLSGNNTAGVLANISSGTMYLAGGNNVTLSQNANSITISGVNTHAQQTGISGIAGSAASTVTAGTVQFGNLNNISFGLNGSTMTASYSQSIQTQSILSPLAVVGNTAGTNYTLQNGQYSWSAGNNITLSQNSSNTNIIVISGANTHAQQTGISGISATDTLYNSGTVLFTGSNMITVKSSGAGQTIILDATQSIQTQSILSPLAVIGNTAGTNYTLQNGQYSWSAGNNITLSQNSSNTNIIVISGANTHAQQTGISGIAGSAASTVTAGTVQFGNLNNISFGLNGSTMTASYSQSIQTQSILSPLAIVGNTAGTNYTLQNGQYSWSAGNNITLSQNSSNTNIIVISGANVGGAQTGISGIAGSAASTVTVGTVQFANGNNVTFGLNGSTMTASASYSAETFVAGIAGSAASTVTNGTIQFGNANNMSFGLNGSTMTASFSSTPQTFVAGIAGSAASTVTNGTVQFGNLNNISFGLNGSTMTASYSQSIQTQSILSPLAIVGNTAGTNYTLQNGQYSWSGGPNITLSQNSSNTNIIVISAPAPGAAAENNWITLAGNIAAGSNSSASGSTIQWSGGNNITLAGTNNSIVMISGPNTHAEQTGISGISATNTMYISGSVLFTGSNMITVKSSAAGQTIILDATQSIQTQNSVLVNGSSGGISISGGNNITAGNNASTVTFSVHAPQTGISGISATNTLYSSGSVLFTGSNMITVKSSAAGQTIILDATQSVQTQNSVLINGSSGGISISGGNNITAGNNASTVTFSVHAQQTGISGISATNTLYNSGTVLFTGSNMITVKSSGAGQTIILDATQSIQTQNSVLVNGSSGGISISGGNNITAGNNASTVTFSVHAPQTGISVIGVVGSTNIFTSGSVIFSGSANITLSTSLNGASQYILISAPAPGAGGGIVVVPNAYATTFSTGSVFFSGLANITINSSVNGASQYIQISAPAPGGGGAATVKIYQPVEYMVTANMAQGTVFVQPMHIPYNMTATQLNVLMFISNSASGGGTMSWNVGLYTYAVSTANTISSTLVTRAYNSTLGGSSSASNISGTRYRGIALNNWAFTPGDYLLAIGLSVVTELTSGTYSMYGGSRVSIIGSEYSGAGNLLRWGYNGVFSAATNAVRASFHISDINRTGALVNGQWWFNLLGTA